MKVIFILFNCCYTQTGIIICYTIKKSSNNLPKCNEEFEEFDVEFDSEVIIEEFTVSVDLENDIKINIINNKYFDIFKNIFYFFIE